MRKSRFTEEQMVAVIRDADRDGVLAVAKRHKVSEQTLCTWRKRFEAFQPNHVRRLKQLEQENGVHFERRSTDVRTQDTLARRHNPSRDDAGGLHGASRRPGTAAASAPDPLPWSPRAKRETARPGRPAIARIRVPQA